MPDSECIRIVRKKTYNKYPQCGNKQEYPAQQKYLAVQRLNAILYDGIHGLNTHPAMYGTTGRIQGAVKNAITTPNINA